MGVEFVSCISPVESGKAGVSFNRFLPSITLRVNFCARDDRRIDCRGLRPRNAIGVAVPATAKQKNKTPRQAEGLNIFGFWVPDKDVPAAVIVNV